MNWKSEWKTTAIIARVFPAEFFPPMGGNRWGAHIFASAAGTSIYFATLT